jgi:hypothetical protein
MILNSQSEGQLLLFENIYLLKKEEVIAELN